MKLVDKYYSHPDIFTPWKIYDHRTGRKLSDDYGAEIADSYYDYMTVVYLILKTDKKGNQYYRVTVR